MDIQNTPIKTHRDHGSAALVACSTLDANYIHVG